MSFKVSIDAGHAMTTGGKRTPALPGDLYIDGSLVKRKGECIHEFEFNSKVAKALGNALTRCGIEVMYVNDMTGASDTALSVRANRANEFKSDLHVSCHYNAIGSCASFQTKCEGLLVLKTLNCSSKSDTLANSVHDAIKNNYGHTYGVGIDKNWSGFTLAILRQTNMPAILIEFGFMDLYKEAIKMLDPVWYTKLAEDTAKGICDYLGTKYKAKETVVVEKPIEKPVEQKPVVEKPVVEKPIEQKPVEQKPVAQAKVDVKGLQTALNKTYKCKLSVDGLYGPATKDVIRQHPLQRGFKSDQVKWLQQALKSLGYSLTVDSSFGPATEKAVKKFQKDYKLLQDGYAGVDTHTKIITKLK